MFRRRKARELTEQYDSVLFPENESDSDESSIEGNGGYSNSSEQRILPVTLLYAQTILLDQLCQLCNSPNRIFYILINNKQHLEENILI